MPPKGSQNRQRIPTRRCLLLGRARRRRCCLAIRTRQKGAGPPPARRRPSHPPRGPRCQLVSLERRRVRRHRVRLRQNQGRSGDHPRPRRRTTRRRSGRGGKAVVSQRRLGPSPLLHPSSANLDPDQRLASPHKPLLPDRARRLHPPPLRRRRPCFCWSRRAILLPTSRPLVRQGRSRRTQRSEANQRHRRHHLKR